MTTKCAVFFLVLVLFLPSAYAKNKNHQNRNLSSADYHTVKYECSDSSGVNYVINMLAADIPGEGTATLVIGNGKAATQLGGCSATVTESGYEILCQVAPTDSSYPVKVRRFSVSKGQVIFDTLEFSSPGSLPKSPSFEGGVAACSSPIRS